jgi:hypothetical protein
MAPILHLGGDSYTILNISYDDHYIILAETDVLGGNNCPRVSHNVSFGQEWLNYTDSLDSLTFFFDCYLNQPPPDLSDYQINCKGFSGDGVSFVFTSEKVDVSQEYDLAGHCNHTFEVPIQKDPLPGSGQQLMLPTAYGAVLKRGFELEWNQNTEPPCNLCEQSGGRCAYAERKELLGCLCPGASGRSGLQRQRRDPCLCFMHTPRQSSGKFLRTDRSILIPFENKRYLYHKSCKLLLNLYSRLMSYEVTAISSNQVFTIHPKFCCL